ncbi:MAG TPA: hypothetical protein VHZ24_13670 [Pirellulales bacterium]|jgi:hypothetical protein|nr:hypothetical protein [Pirellulales bacterium]
MRRPTGLTRDELVAIVDALQQALYLDADPELGIAWDTSKVWDGADICGEMAAVLARFDLAPERLTTFDRPDSR